MTDRKDPADNGLGAPRRRAMVRLLLWIGLVLALGAGVLAALAGLGHRWGWWGIRDGFDLLHWSVYTALASLAFSSVGFLAASLLRRWRLMLAAVPGLVLAAAVAAVPLIHIQKGENAPPIHDITTDTDEPPAFIALREAREAAPNAVDYPGESTARVQAQAYPDIAPLVVAAPKLTVFDAALAEAEAQGWHIASAELEEGRIEAVATTFWFGFKDDVVVRVRAIERESEPAATRIDARSASRVGVGDMGTNARRVRTYLRELSDRLDATE